MHKKSTTLVLGASLKPERYSNKAIKSLLSHNQPVRAIGLRPGNINEVVIDTATEVYQDIETVTLYLNPRRQVEYYDYILSLEPKRVIFNPGTENQEFQELLASKGIQTEIACTLVLLATNQYQTEKSE